MDSTSTLKMSPWAPETSDVISHYLQHFSLFFSLLVVNIRQTLIRSQSFVENYFIFQSWDCAPLSLNLLLDSPPFPQHFASGETKLEGHQANDTALSALIPYSQIAPKFTSLL